MKKLFSNKLSAVKRDERRKSIASIADLKKQNPGPSELAVPEKKQTSTPPTSPAKPVASKSLPTETAEEKKARFKAEADKTRKLLESGLGDKVEKIIQEKEKPDDNKENEVNYNTTEPTHPVYQAELNDEVVMRGSKERALSIEIPKTHLHTLKKFTQTLSVLSEFSEEEQDIVHSFAVLLSDSKKKILKVEKEIQANLEQQLQNERANTEKLTNELNDETVRSERLQQQVKEHEKRVAQQQQELSEERQRLQGLEQQLQTERQLVEQLQQQLLQEQEKSGRLEKELSDEKTTTASLQDQLKQEKETIEELQKSLQSTQDELANTKTQLAETKQQLVYAKEDKRIVLQEVDDLSMELQMQKTLVKKELIRRGSVYESQVNYHLEEERRAKEKKQWVQEKETLLSEISRMKDRYTQARVRGVWVTDLDDEDLDKETTHKDNDLESGDEQNNSSNIHAAIDVALVTTLENRAKQIKEEKKPALSVQIEEKNLAEQTDEGEVTPLSPTRSEINFQIEMQEAMLKERERQLQEEEVRIERELQKLKETGQDS